MAGDIEAFLKMAAERRRQAAQNQAGGNPAGAAPQNVPANPVAANTMSPNAMAPKPMPTRQPAPTPHPNVPRPPAPNPAQAYPAQRPQAPRPPAPRPPAQAYQPPRPPAARPSTRPGYPAQSGYGANQGYGSAAIPSNKSRPSANRPADFVDAIPLPDSHNPYYEDDYARQSGSYGNDPKRSRLVNDEVSSLDISSHADQLGQHLRQTETKFLADAENRFGGHDATYDRQQPGISLASDVIRMLTEPRTVRAAVILNEILKRPDFD